MPTYPLNGVENLFLHFRWKGLIPGRLYDCMNGHMLYRSHINGKLQLFRHGHDLQRNFKGDMSQYFESFFLCTKLLLK